MTLNLVSTKPGAAQLSAPSISGYKETGEIEYAADTTLDHMAVMDENESPVEVHVTKN